MADGLLQVKASRVLVPMQELAGMRLHPLLKQRHICARKDLPDSPSPSIPESHRTGQSPSTEEHMILRVPKWRRAVQKMSNNSRCHAQHLMSADEAVKHPAT